MVIYSLKVKDSAKDRYFPSWLHSGIGYIYQEDDEHIWVKFFIPPTGNSNGHVTSVIRYIREDIELTALDRI